MINAIRYDGVELGTLPLSAVSKRFPRVRRKLEAERRIGAASAAPCAVIRDEDVAELPSVVRRYLGFMRVVGRPRRRSFVAGFTGRFRLGPTAPWKPCEAWQLDVTDPVERAFYMRTSMGPGLPTFVRDTYEHGHARMLAKVFDAVPVVDVERPELDLSELVTYLNDGIMIAPSMLLGPATTWVAVSDEAFDVHLTDCERTVTARVELDERGAPKSFSTWDRFGNDPYRKGNPFVRALWSTPVTSWTTCDDGPVMCEGAAVWHFEGGSFAYVQMRLVPGSLAFDREIAPGP